VDQGVALIVAAFITVAGTAVGALYGARVGANAAIRAAQQQIETTERLQRETWARQDAERFIENRRAAYLRLVTAGFGMAYRLAVVPVQVETATALYGDLSAIEVAAADLGLVTRSPDVRARADALWEGARQFAMVASDRKSPPTVDSLNEARTKLRALLTELRTAAAADLGTR
jgi:hypothetical protein